MWTNWITPSHLAVTYKGRASLDFQVKIADIDVTVQDLSREPTNTKDSK